MGYEKETIFAPSAPAGGAISVIRISGNIAHSALDAVFNTGSPKSRETFWGGRSVSCKKEHARLYHGFIEHNGKRIDEVMAVYFYAPNSYTGEDMAEIHCHGGQATVSGILRALSQSGLRLAEPGEFTKRAFMSGKMDLSAAGAVMELINASSSAGAAAALRQLSGGLFQKITAAQGRLTDALSIIEAGIEYPEEDIEADIKRDALPLLTESRKEISQLSETFKSGRMLIEGFRAVIAGRPNVGKSSLFNMLLGKERAIVTQIPGTTRDVVDDCIIKNGVILRLVDTAGLREGAGEVEHIGIERAKYAVETADIIIFVIDISAGITEEDKEVFRTLGDNVIVVLNKCDLPRKTDAREALTVFGKETVEVSALTGKGRDVLLERIAPPELNENEDVVITNERHYGILLAAQESLSSAIEAFDAADLDCVTIDIKEAWDRLGEITGVTVTEEIINSIFDKFCLGK